MARHSEVFVDMKLKRLREYYDKMIPGERISLERLRKQLGIANSQTIRIWLMERLGIEVREICGNFYAEKPLFRIAGGIAQNGEEITGLVGLVQLPHPISKVLGYGPSLGTIVGTLCGTNVATIIADSNTALISLEPVVAGRALLQAKKGDGNLGSC